MDWWSALGAADKAAWLSAIATAMATVTAVVSLLVAGLAFREANAANRWNRFDRRAEIHWKTHVYLRAVLAAGFKLDAPLTSNWWRDIWLHRFLFQKDILAFLDQVFESGAALEHLKSELDEADEDAEENKKRRSFHQQRIAKAVDELDAAFAPYLQFGKS